MSKRKQLSFKQNCRVCLEQSQNMVSIFIEDDSQILANKISDCGGITIEFDSDLQGYPDKICPKCMAFLNIAYKFRTSCQSTDNLLKTVLKTKIIPEKNSSKSTVFIKNVNIKEDETHETELERMFEEQIAQDSVIYKTADGGETELYAEEHLIGSDNEQELNETNSTEIIQHFKEEEAFELNEDNLSANSINFENEDEKYYENDTDTHDSEIINNILKDKVKLKKNTKINRNEIDFSNSIENHRTKNVENDNKNSKINEKIIVDKRRIKGVYNKSLIQPKTQIKLRKRSLPIKLEDSTVKKGRKCSQTEYICEICGNKYKKKVLLDGHMRWHSEKKDYQCEVCNRKFTVNFQLTRHMRVHTGDKPYTCSFCNRKFSDYSTCKKHQRTHTDERPFKCDICDKAFNYSHVLRVHMATHTGEKPYKCNQCHKKFSQPHHLKAHLATLYHQGRFSGGSDTTSQLKSKNEEKQEQEPEIFYTEHEECVLEILAVE